MELFSFFIEPFSQTFMLKALLVSTVLGAICAVLGILLLCRGLSLVGDGLAHSAFGTLGLGVLAGFSTSTSFWLSCLSTTVASLALKRLSVGLSVSRDALIGVWFTLALAIGALAVHLAQRLNMQVIDLEAILFGNIIFISEQDFWISLISCVGILGALIWVFPRYCYVSFYEELAELDGIPSSLVDYLFMGILGYTVALGSRVAGVALVSAFLIIPAVTAMKRKGDHLGRILLWSVGRSVLSAWVGLWLSYYLDVPTGPTIILIMGIFSLISVGNFEAR